MVRKRKKSEKLFAEAARHIAGGVNSPVRAFGAVGGAPVFAARGKGSKLFDVDGNRYVDYCMSWGPLILGHAHPRVIAAVKRMAARGTSYGMPTHGETELARLISGAMPSVEMIRMTSSGTEAAMSAIRLARAFTGRRGIVKFEGCYHGHSDSLLAKAGSGVLTHGVPGSAGVNPEVVRDTIVLAFNDFDAIRRTMEEKGDGIAAIIVEPVPANMGVIPPKPGFLEELRRLSDGKGTLLIFDEVITGFRLSYGGAQNVYGVRPDMTVLGKIIGGGLPAAAYGGRRDIMEKLAPTGPVYQAGTLSGNPLAVGAGIATLKILKRLKYSSLDARAGALCEGLSAAARENAVNVSISKIGSMFTLFFAGAGVSDYTQAQKCDTGLYKRFFHGMLDNGFYFPPSQFEAAFVSTAHSNRDISDTVRAAERVFKTL